MPKFLHLTKGEASVQVYLKTGDITRDVRVDAIVTLINPGGAWFGGVDGAIQRVAGSQYHGQAAEALGIEGLQDGKVVIATGDSRNHHGHFDNVVFVVDDLRQRLRFLVQIGLEACWKEGYKTVAFPMMRTGVMLGAVERDHLEVVREMEAAFENFEKAHPNSPLKVVVVVYADPTAVQAIEATLALESNGSDLLLTS